MRIIAGEYKGRKLNAPMDERVRPTSEKVREAIYSMLLNNIYDAVIVDLFAGTGGLGLEGLSRGARKCYFCDKSRDSLKLITENIKKCGAEDSSVVIPSDFMRALERIHDKCDILLLDPPYMDGLYVKAMENALALDILNEDAICVCEHDMGENLPEQVGTLKKIKTKRYGRIGVTIYRIDKTEK